MTTGRSDPYLHEQVLLLALRDDRGTIEGRAGWYSLALGGAVLSELLLAGRIRIEEGDRGLVDVVDRTKLGDPVLDDCLDMTIAAKRRRSARDWIRAFAAVKRLRHRIAEGLARRGILKDAEDKVLLLFTRKVYPTVDPAPERKLRDTLRRAVLRDSRTVAPRTAILVALTHATGLLRVVLDRDDLKRRRKRLERIANGDLVGGAIREAVQAAQAAVLVTTILAATTATTTASFH